MRGTALAPLAGALLAAASAAPGYAQELRAVQVFVGLAQRAGDIARAEYLKAIAGSRVEGAGKVEAVLPRAYYDTSVPDSNPAVALIRVGPGRKVACGLPRALGETELRAFPEGTTVAFRGKLVDAHDWGEWSTLYLGDCALHTQ